MTRQDEGETITSYTGAILTPEQHTDRLMTAIQDELDTYGVESLAALIATLLDMHIGNDAYLRAALAFRRIEDGQF